MRIKIEDHKDTRRLVMLFNAAVRLGVVEKSDRETFVALAEHSLEEGRNPVALFTWLLEHRSWWTQIGEAARTSGKVRLAEYQQSRTRAPGSKAKHERFNCDTALFGIRRRRTVFGRDEKP